VRIRRAHHVAQAVGRVRRDQLQPVGTLAIGGTGRREELLERPVEGVHRDPLRLETVEHVVVGVDAGRQGMRAQQPAAEAVDGGDRGSLSRARVVAAPELEETRAHPLPHLGGGLVGERDREHALDGNLVVHHRPHEALDEHRGLPGAGPGPHQERPVAAVHDALLLGCEAHRSHRQSDG
jgi:hypothetical protein